MASTENSRRPRYETRSQTLEGHSLPLQRPSIHLTYSSSSCQWPTFWNYFTIHHHFCISQYHRQDCKTRRLSCGVLAAVVVQERLYPKILMNFQQKNSRRLLTPPPIPFRKTMLRFFPEIGDRITVYNGKNLQHSFLDRKWPLLWKLGRHRPLIVGT